MDEQQAAPAVPTAQRRETVAEILPGTARAEALDALLRDVEGLRLVLETDLTLAAAATEAGAVDVALDVVDADRDELTRFSQRSLRRLRAERRPRRRLPLAPLIPLTAALTVAVLALGTPALGGPPATARAGSDAVRSWSQFAGLVDRSAPLADLRSAAERLHADVRTLLDSAPADPVAALAALSLLRSEHEVLARLPDRRPVADLLAQVAALTARLLGALPVQRAPEPGSP